MYVILVIMILGIIPSIAMILPYPDKFERKKNEWKISENLIIEGECSEWKLWILRGCSLIVMIVMAERVYNFCTSGKSFFVAGIIYVLAFFLHYIIYIKLDTRYYLSEKGVWINRIEGVPISYDEIYIEKIWRTIAPFSGCAGNLKICYKLDYARHTITIPKSESKITFNNKLLSEQELVLKWIFAAKKEKESNDEKKQRIFKIIGISTIITGLVMTMTFGCFLCKGMGIVEGTEKNSYKNVLYKDQAFSCEIDTIYASKQGTLYVLFADVGCVGVYDKYGEFLYTYHVPKGKNGTIEFAIKNSHIYIKNRDDVVYIYENKKFLKKQDLDLLTSHETIDFVKDQSNMDMKNVIVRQNPIFYGDQALPYMLLGIILTIGGGAIYNRGRYKVDMKNV